jgi:diguanylate cyclase (GGDEF)-like protein
VTGEDPRTVEECEREIAALKQTISDLQSKLHEQSMRDAHTGLYNRRYLEDVLEREVQLARRRRAELALIICDLDHFKVVNERFGQRVGDAVLKSVSSVLASRSRSTDICCRYGGEELVLVLPGSNRLDAAARAEQLRELAAAATHMPALPDAHVTVSFGVAGLPDNGTTADELLAAAEAALYVAKHNGRNRVELAPPVMRLVR